ncbi:glycosyltransferase family 2 protein [Microbulbifer sp. GL-2]|uniref:glycosyltransferase family 2 protein n=1 Tax=Microbulbifer sp. GL-2 TaxID=2591606 RepID=UPI001163E4C8|nr:glycosyltransferase family 2 protein [Microbulbifer sp. GL-2]BBM03885.1 glycosyl transferase [Microbulbifer sp. GL-2]
MKKVSIITVCYDSVDTIQDTLESVLKQDYPNIEYIIVDGGSTDGTMDIVKCYSGRISTIVSEPDRGIYDAMNKGIELASGDFVGILNSDDVYTDNRVISDIMKQLTMTNSDCIYGDLEIVAKDDLNHRLRFCSSRKFSISKFRWGWMIPHPTFFVKLSCYKRLGLYKLGYRISADFELLVRFLYLNRISSTRLPRCIVRMRQGGLALVGFFPGLTRILR